jgi:hypothetical protein
MSCKTLRSMTSVSHAGAGSGPVPPREPAERGVTPPVKLTLDGFEVTQAIQDMAHSVPLVASKTTMVRVYLSAAVGGPIMVLGVLLARRKSPAGQWQPIPSLGAVVINPAENGQLRLKRESENKSLNFLLPTALCAAGSCELKLSAVFQTTPFKPLIGPPAAKKTVQFETSPPLRVRILGIRFNGGTPPVPIEPSALDFALIRSWLRRAYPVARVTWSQLTVNAPQAWPFNAATINAFVRGIRMTDLLGGMDARTHYYGLVSDGNGSFFMRGLASGIPGTPDPSTVASGPTGVNTWGWDTDGSYGDWYTGHELGHTFGRFHAEFCGAGGGAPYPFTNGQLSNADGAFVGFDVGDASRGIPGRALPGVVWHDVMSYCASQWLSSFTYIGIRDRLVLEDAIPAGAMPRAARPQTRRKAMQSSGTVHVVATLNLTRGTGHLQHVTPVPAVPAGQGPTGSVRRRSGSPAAPAADVSLRLYGTRDRLIAEIAPAFIPDACLNPGDDLTGAIDTFLTDAGGASRLELLLNGVVVDTVLPAAPARAVQNIRAETATQRARARGARAAVADEVVENPVITWSETGGRARTGAARALPDTGRTYTVQVSTDEGTTWQTVGFALREPRVVIDREALGRSEDVLVRITSTDGFRSVSSQRKFKVADLS